MNKFKFRKNSLLFQSNAYGVALVIPLLAGSTLPEIHGKTLEGTNEPLEEKVSQVADIAEFTEGGIKKGFAGNRLIAANDKSDENSNKSGDEPRVLITEVVIEGLDGHPDQEALEFAAYDAMTIRPGSRVDRQKVQLDLDAIYATGWFSGVRVEPINGPLGIQLLVEVQPNPVLRKVEFQGKNEKLPNSVIAKIFAGDYGKTLNLNTLQIRIKELKKWYVNQGFPLARISGPNRITKEGVVQLKIIEGIVSGVEIKFLNKEGEEKDEKGNPIKGKTKLWVIQREISIKPGESFNRNKLEKDIKRLYETTLFSDIKVSLRPVPGDPGNVMILLGITEQQTGSLTGGVGYSQGQGVFGQIGLEEKNFLGHSWSTKLNITYGQYGGLVNFSFADPWIRGDSHRTSFRTALFVSREVPQEFRSQEGGSIRSVEDYYDQGNYRAYDINSSEHGYGKFGSVNAAKADTPGQSWFDYEDGAVAISRTGGNFSFARPLNGGDPYKEVPWSVLLGVNFQRVQAIDYAGNKRPYGVLTDNLKTGSAPNREIICVAFDCALENNLVGVRAAANYNTLDDERNPTSGNFLSLGTEQYISVGRHSPIFTRARVGYTHFLPVNWLKLSKGCRPRAGEKLNCPQTIGFQLKGGTIVGQLPPYEAFCVGGSNSVRGWNSCDLAVGRTFGEASVEYRFPIWRLLAGSLFMDGATDLGSQHGVPGKPGKLLGKPGSGFSLGSGLILNTPVGPLRLEAASQNLSGDMRYNLGVGWKF